MDSNIILWTLSVLVLVHLWIVKLETKKSSLYFVYVIIVHKPSLSRLYDVSFCLPCPSPSCVFSLVWPLHLPHPPYLLIPRLFCVFGQAKLRHLLKACQTNISFWVTCTCRFERKCPSEQFNIRSIFFQITRYKI